MIKVLKWSLTWLAALSLATTTSASGDDALVSVRFYGEAECPFCREFVTGVWKEVWTKMDDLHPYLDYQFVAWGNAYFATEKCGKGPEYSRDERRCWFQNCIATTADDEEACFGGDAIYQHGEKEGQLNVYETCVKEEMGLDTAIAFMECIEGPNMDDSQKSAADLMHDCLDTDATDVQDCSDKRGHELEVRSAKATPDHPGVPFVVVDGAALDNPMEVVAAICGSLDRQGISGLKSCSKKVERSARELEFCY